MQVNWHSHVLKYEKKSKNGFTCAGNTLFLTCKSGHSFESRFAENWSCA